MHTNIESDRMFKARFRSWNFRKYLSKRDWQVFAVLQEQRRAAGKAPCKVEMHNRIRSGEDFMRHLKQQNTSKAAFLAEAGVENLSIPDGIRCLETTTDSLLAGGNGALSSYLWQVANPECGVMPVRPSYVELTAIVPQPVLSLVEGDTNACNSFISGAMMACMSAAAGNLLAAGRWVKEASHKLEKLCKNHDPQLLPGLSTLLVWLEVHDEGSTGAGLMRSFCEVASNILGKENPICVILQWMAATANKKLVDCGIDTSVLHQAWMDINMSFGANNPQTIVAGYCLCFHMMRIDRSYSEAERILSDLYHSASESLGSTDLQTINILATLSRAQSRQGNFRDALESINKALEETPWGTNHPHRLELLLRKAAICGKLGLEEEREELYWLIVRGRVAALGKHHRSTQKTYDSLVEILKHRGRWETSKGSLQQLLVDPNIALESYEGWWQQEVIRERKEVKEAEDDEDWD